MNKVFATKYKRGDRVRILSNIGKQLENDRVGKVTNVDGWYINIRLNKSKAIVERYPNEIEKLT